MPAVQEPGAIWLKKNDFKAHNLAEKYFWQHSSPICILTTKGCKVISLVLVCGSVSLFHTVLSHGGRFEDIAPNLPFLATLFFGNVVVYALENAAVPGRSVWNYIENNPQFSYSKPKYERMKRIHTLLMKAFNVYLCLVIVGSFILCELAYCDDPTDYACGLVYPNYLFNNLSPRPYRELFNLAALYSLGVIIFSVKVACSFLHIYVMFATDCLAEFKSELKLIAETKDPLLRRHKLIKQCDLQRYIWSSSERICDIFKWPMLLQYFTSGVIMGLILISALIKINLVLIGLLVFYTIGCCICGYFGEELARISVGFQDATFYSIPWDGDVESARFLMFMNINLRKQMVLPLGNYLVYTNELVLLVFKVVYPTLMLYINNM